MKKASILIVLVIASISAFAVQATLQFFTARSSGNSVIIDWKSGSETEVAYYEVERAGEDQIFRYVSTVPAKGANYTYSYSDNEAFGKGDQEKVSQKYYFTYRLKIVAADKSFSYSNSSGVSHNVSSIKRTWGMIKEMFR